MTVTWAAIQFGLGPLGWGIFVIVAIGGGVLALRLAGFRGTYLWFAPLVALIGGGILLGVASLVFNGTFGLVVPAALVCIGSIVAAFILRLIVGNPPDAEERAIKKGTTKRCPFCAEMIRPEARVCRYCQREQPV